MMFCCSCVAAGNGHVECVRWLMEMGADSKCG